MVKRVVFGEVANDHVAELKDVNAREFWMLMVLAVAVLSWASGRRRSST